MQMEPTDSPRFLANLRTRRAVEMDVFPLAADFLPDAGFFDAADVDFAGRIERLGQPDVAEDGAVAHDSHMRLSHGDVLGWFLGSAGEVEKIFMEGHADGELATGFGFEASDRTVAERFVGFPVSGDNGNEEFLVEVEELLVGIGGHSSNDLRF